MPFACKSKTEITDEIVGRLVRRHSTAVVLFHHAVADRLGIGPADHKCLDLLRERGSMTGSQLAAVTGHTTGAITGVVARLERAGFLIRKSDPHDGRKQILSPVPERMRDVQNAVAAIRRDATEMLAEFDQHQLQAIAEFLSRSAELAYRHIALLRSEAICPTPPHAK
jgi:DNA-binding MarR family transcriptional regulator